MADEATMTNGPRDQIDSPIVDGIVGNVTEFGGNLLTLAELQARLALLDAREGAGRAVLPVLLAVGGVVLASASLPVVLIAAGLMLAAASGWPLGLSLLLCGASALVLGAGLTFLFGRRVSACFDSFHRSREEFSHNLAWVKTVLSHSGRPMEWRS